MMVKNYVKIAAILIIIAVGICIYLFTRSKPDKAVFSIEQSEVVPIPLGSVNSYLIRGEKNVLVDTGNPGSYEKILAEFKELDVDPKTISLIVITHSHSDHFGSVWELKEATGAKVAIHKLDADCLRTGKNSPLHPSTLTAWISSLFIKSEVKGFHTFEPDILLEDKMSLKEFGVDAHILFTPGHTAGSISVALATGQIITGDIIAGSSSKPEYTSFQQNADNLKTSLEKVMQLSPKIIFSGHGGPFSPQTVYNNLYAIKSKK